MNKLRKTEWQILGIGVFMSVLLCASMFFMTTTALAQGNVKIVVDTAKSKTFLPPAGTVFTAVKEGNSISFAVKNSQGWQPSEVVLFGPNRSVKTGEKVDMGSYTGIQFKHGKYWLLIPVESLGAVNSGQYVYKLEGGLYADKDRGLDPNGNPWPPSLNVK
ncbi:MAG: hypothetical protein WC831_01220 [Parcubacteria group bacterium]